MGRIKNAIQKMNRPIFQKYHDYRELLGDLITYYRNSEKGLSLKLIAEQSDLSSAYISMVLNGKRPLTHDALIKICKTLKLSDVEQKYLDDLRLLVEGSDSNARSLALKRLQRTAAYKKQNQKELEVYRYLTSWAYVAIRELASHPKFEPTTEWIQPRLRTKVAKSVIDEAVAFLKEYSFLTKCLDTGRWIQSEKNLNCITGVYSLALGKFHEEMLEMASRSITEVPATDRTLLGHTFFIPSENFSKINEILERTIKEIAALESPSDNKEQGQVYHVELAAIPLTQPNQVKTVPSGDSLQHLKYFGKKE